MLVPRGNTAQQPGSPVNGMIRYNSQTNKFEGYQAGAWADMISGGGGVPGEWTAAGSDLYYTAGSVAIGTTAMDGSLTVQSPAEGAPVAQEVSFTTPGEGDWTVPSGKNITQVTVEVWGAGGGGGGSGTSNNGAGGGGGGGAYASQVIAVTDGTVLSYQIGAGGAGGAAGANPGNPGEATILGSYPYYFNLVYAEGGAGGSSGSNGAGGSGGLVSNSQGDVIYKGGNGANGVNAVKSGGGGGGAGSSGAGGNATGGTAGSGSHGGGNGGAGVGTANTAGIAGSNAGGGGSGGYRSNSNRAGGAGGPGRVRISWTEMAASNALTVKDKNNNTTLVANSLGKVGIGTTSPVATLDVNGDIRVGSSFTPCTAARRGSMRVVQAGPGFQDYMQVCLKADNDMYYWSYVYSTPVTGGTCGPGNAGFAYVGGGCWFMGSGNQSCVSVCADYSMTYSALTESAGSGGNDSLCSDLAQNYALAKWGSSPYAYIPNNNTCGAGLGCTFVDDGDGVITRCTDVATNASAAATDAYRLCACE